MMVEFDEIHHGYVLISFVSVGVVVPSPACRRALQEVMSVLQSEGHEVIPMSVLFQAPQSFGSPS